ncbi:hypothetical protein J8273_4784 [Carpediemonas membranifera]|uniref:Uncharacterized protein n=1 Tax=Carpediemonas membranifera TaxID=201153 RepID=A0A8J6AVN1_9EUKA|nr:hypothetical protein J8273_4784 [Carpediemonas membranifera]|eukprot:KAG9393665.1 hypothetical protein J8273_4784 [Carpediemonas membranifera]
MGGLPPFIIISLFIVVLTQARLFPPLAVEMDPNLKQTPDPRTLPRNVLSSTINITGELEQIRDNASHLTDPDVLAKIRSEFLRDAAWVLGSIVFFTLSASILVSIVFCGSLPAFRRMPHVGCASPAHSRENSLQAQFDFDSILNELDNDGAPLKGVALFADGQWVEEGDAEQSGTDVGGSAMSFSKLSELKVPEAGETPAMGFDGCTRGPI